MLDLTKIKTPFGLLDAETQKALKAHHRDGGKIEIYKGDLWSGRDGPVWANSATYRAKPEPRVLKVRYGVGKVWRNGELPSISESNFGPDHWRAMTGEIVVGNDGWPVSITIKREGAE